MRAVQESLPAGYPIRQSADLRICAPPRGFSQLITAFIAPRLQGIRRGPMLRLTILSLPPRADSAGTADAQASVRPLARAGFSSSLQPFAAASPSLVISNSVLYGD